MFKEVGQKIQVRTPSSLFVPTTPRLRTGSTIWRQWVRPLRRPGERPSPPVAATFLDMTRSLFLPVEEGVFLPAEPASAPTARIITHQPRACCLRRFRTI